MSFSVETYLLQTGLVSLGFNPGERDGLPGKNTSRAIAEFTASDLNPNKAKSGRAISAEGLELVEHFEGLYLKAYKDEVGVWTIGWGHTGLTHKDGTVFAGRTITKQEAVDLLQYDLTNFGANVSKVVKVDLNDNQFSALVSFDFNTGGLSKSTLLKKLNAGDFKGAADEFPRWNKAGGKVLAGLTRRRKSERNLFLGVKPAIVIG